MKNTSSPPDIVKSWRRRTLRELAACLLLAVAALVFWYAVFAVMAGCDRPQPERLVTLDSGTRILATPALLVADRSGPVAKCWALQNGEKVRLVGGALLFTARGRRVVLSRFQLAEVKEGDWLRAAGELGMPTCYFDELPRRERTS
jgi:hypothetical protein